MPELIGEPGRYGLRAARWLDTGERFKVVTIEGKPVGIEPSRAALEAYAEEMGLELVSKELMRDLLRLRATNAA